MTKKTGRPTKRTVEIENRIIEGLTDGTPLTVICREDGMPGVRTVYDWMEADADLSAAIARAREMGFDAIAVDCMDIADDKSNDTVNTEHGEKPNTEWITRSRLRVETRLKLLAKWDPKRYGDLVKHGNADGSNIDIAAALAAGNARVMDGD